MKRGVFGRVVSRESAQLRFYDVPTIAPVRNTMVADLPDRLPCENLNIVSRRSAEEKMADIAVTDYRELEGAIARRIELMCSQLLLKGEISYQLDSGET